MSWLSFSLPSRGEVEPLALFEPAVEELTNGRSDAVSPAGGLLVDEVTECSVRCT